MMLTQKSSTDVAAAVSQALKVGQLAAAAQTEEEEKIKYNNNNMKKYK